MNYFRSFLQMDQVKMNNFNDYVYHFLQLIQVKRNNFNYYVCDLLQLIDIFLHAKLAHNLKENPSKITKTPAKP